MYLFANIQLDLKLHPEYINYTLPFFLKNPSLWFAPECCWASVFKLHRIILTENGPQKKACLHEHEAI
jgi:hypothetical protein